MAPKKPTSTQNTTLQTMGMDVIKQYPGPLSLTVSRAVKLAIKSRLPGKHSVFPHLTGAEQNALYAGTAVEFTVKYGNVSAPSAAPSSNSPDPHRAPTLCRFGCAILGLGQAADPPSADPLGGVDMSLLQRAGVLQNTPYAA